MNPSELNKVIHERVRLAIMSALATRGKLTFPELKEMLEVSDGNLSVHAAKLEEHGLIMMLQQFKTWMNLKNMNGQKLKMRLILN